MKCKEAFRNFLGAFSDGAVLFPLLALLSMKAGFSGPVILFTTGLTYVVSAYLFKVPMAVQPLKSIAIAAVTAGASFAEVRISGMLLGFYCLFMCFLNVDQIAKKVPSSLIHELQAGLGVLLILQGAKAFGGWEALTTHALVIAVFGGVLFMLFLPEIRGIPILGLLATVGLAIAVFSPQLIPVGASIQAHQQTGFEGMRLNLILGLLIPQIILTSANSVLATKDVCARYFGEKASRVTVRRLLYSIGIGNLIVGILGGMPFCHGSDGVTAHVRGGSKSPWSTATMGFALLFLAAIQFVKGAQVLIYPAILVSILLMTTGLFHLKLATPTLRTEFGPVKIVGALLITAITSNLLWVLGFGVLLELALKAIHPKALTISEVKS